MAKVTSKGIKTEECVTYTISGQSNLCTGDKIPFDTIYNKTDKNSSFKLDGNEILFLKECKILFSATFPCFVNGTTLWIRTTLNDKTINTIIVNLASAGYQTLAFTPKIISAKANDRLSISIVSTTDYAMIGGNLDNTDAVYLTIQKID